MRHALARLQEQGLISRAGRRGYSVTVLGLQDVAEILFLRTLLEGAAAELAAKRISDEELRELERLARKTYAPGDRVGYARFVRVNRKFHLLLAQASGNTRLVRAIAGLLDDMRRVITGTVTRTHQVAAMQHEHRAVVATLRRRDPAAAKAAVIAALTAGQQRIVEGLSLASLGP